MPAFTLATIALTLRQNGSWRRDRPMHTRFLTFELDAGRRELRDGGRTVALSPKLFDLLAYLVEHRDRMVTKAELLDAFWPANVSEAALQKAVSQLRKALGTPDIVRTHHGLGFCFGPTVENGAAGPPATDEPDAAASEAPTALRERRFATVLSVLIEASAEDPEPTEAFLAEARERIGTHRGDLMRTTSEGFAAAFGLGLDYEDGARRAVHCAVALRRAAERSRHLDVAMAVHCGPVEVAPDDAAWTLPGAIERGAARLAAAGRDGDVLLSSAALSQLADEVRTEPAGDGVRLLAVNPMRAGIPGRPRRRPNPFVGRAAEMAFLDMHLRQVVTGHGRAVLLSGPAGIGKSRLVAEFLGRLPAEPASPVVVPCLPGLSGSPRALIREICRALFPQDPPGLLPDELDRAVLADLREEGVTRADALERLSDHQRRRRELDVLRRSLAAICEARPLVLVLEDVHWIDATSHDLLEALLRGVDRVAALVVMTTRPGDAVPLAGPVLHLSPLSRQDSLALLRADAGDIPLADDVADRLVERAAGNPFFVEELALAARSGGDPTRNLPDTVQAVIGVRIGTLAPEPRAVLQAMAVIGPPAPVDLVAHLLGCPQEFVARALRRLTGAGFVWEEADGLGFRHILIGDAAYAMLAPRERGRLHAQIAAHLEATPEAEAARPETLAWHHQEAGDAARAVAFWTEAARAALRRSARREAAAFARNGLALIDPGWAGAERDELALQLCLGSALTALQGSGAGEVGAAYRRADMLCRVVGDSKARVRVQVGLWLHTWVAGRLTASLGHAKELLALAGRTHDPAPRLQASASMGEVLLHMGRVPEALGHLQDGLRAIGATPPATPPEQNSAVACASYGAWACALMGRGRDARHFEAVAADLAQVHDNAFARAIHTALCAEPFMFLGDAPPCLDRADRAVALGREHDFAFWLGTGLVMRGWALGQSGRMDDAFEALDEGIAVFERTGARVQLAHWHGLRAETLLRAGRAAEADRVARHALDCAERAKDVFFTPRIHAVAAQVAAARGDDARRAAHRRRAEDRARRFGLGPRMLDLG